MRCDHIVGLNCGRWDYIFSYIKNVENHLRSRPAGQAGGNDGQTVSERLLAPDQNLSQARRAFAMGGMAAFIPSKDVERNNQVLAKVKADKALKRTTATTARGLQNLLADTGPPAL